MSNLIIWGYYVEGTMGRTESLVSARGMEYVRPDVTKRGNVWRRHDFQVPIIIEPPQKSNLNPIHLCHYFQLSEDGPRVLHLSASGSAANLSRPNYYRHHQVLLHLHVGPFRVWMR
jgi:hypothetical protein